MSEIKVNSIKGVGASTAAITVNNTDGTCTANITNNLSNRNLIINGAMQVAQRGTSSTSGGYQTVDRFQNATGGVDEAPTQAQVDVSSGTTPYTLGFRKAYKITNGNQTGGAGTSDNIIALRYHIEAQDIANSGWNYTSSSSNVTLQFWIKSSVAQSFQGVLTSEDGTRQIFPFETGSLSADTWTKITKTISGNSNVTFDNDNGKGLTLEIIGFSGSDFATDSATINAWQARTEGNQFGRASTSTWYTTNDATFDITGVQLEVGSVATDFEHRSYGQELALCQRYFQVITEKGGDGHSLGCGMNQSSSTGHLVVPFHCTMRTTPSLDQLTGTNYYILLSNGGNETFDSWSLDANTVTPQRAELYKSGISITQGSANLCRYNNTNAEIRFSAEI
jgi:hypothetical protein